MDGSLVQKRTNAQQLTPHIAQQKLKRIKQKCLLLVRLKVAESASQKPALKTPI